MIGFTSKGEHRRRATGLQIQFFLWCEMMSEKRATFKPFGVALPFFLFGVACLLIGRHVYLKGIETMSWENVPGKIISSGASHRRESGSGANKTTEAYYPYWEYEYFVHGVRFTSGRIREAEGTQGYNNSEKAERYAVARYPVGTKVTVYYDPADPGSARLFQGSDRNGLIVIFGCGIFLIALSLALYFGLRRYARSQQSSVST